MRKKDTLQQIEDKADEISKLIEEIRAEARRAQEEEATDEGDDDGKG